MQRRSFLLATATSFVPMPAIAAPFVRAALGADVLAFLAKDPIPVGVVFHRGLTHEELEAVRRRLWCGLRAEARGTQT